MYKGAALAVSLLAPGAALAQAAGDASGIACEVSGYDVIIRNAGPAPIAAGTQVAWSVRFARREGQVTLDDALQPGEIVFIGNVLGTYLGTRTPCEISMP